MASTARNLLTEIIDSFDRIRTRDDGLNYDYVEGRNKNDKWICIRNFVDLHL